MDTNQKDSTNQQAGMQVPPAQQVPQQPSDINQSGGGMPPTITPHGKEAAPVSTQVGEVSDYVEPAAHETAPVIEQAVENAGVVESHDPERMQVTHGQQAVGIIPAKESTPVTLHDDPGFSTPMTIPQAEQASKGNPNRAMTWLGNLIVMVSGQEKAKKENGGH